MAGVPSALTADAGGQPTGENWRSQHAQLQQCIASGDTEALRQFICSCTAAADASVRQPWRDILPSAMMQQPSLETVRILIEAGADVNALDVTGNTAIMLGTLFGGPPMIDFLVSSGAHVNKRNFGGFTALAFAAKAGRADCIAALLAAGASCRAINYGGETPLVLAAGCQVVQADAAAAAVAAVLAGGGAEALIDQQDASGQTPLIAAARMGHEEVIELLLSRNAAVNKCTVGGVTALMAAVESSSAGACKRLVAAGACLHAQRADGETALGLARRSEASSALLRALKADQGGNQAKGPKKQVSEGLQSC